MIYEGKLNIKEYTNEEYITIKALTEYKMEQHN